MKKTAISSVEANKTF